MVFFFAFDLLHRNDWVARLLVCFQLVLFPILCECSVVMSLTCLSIRPSISAVLTGTLCMGDQASFYNVATSWLMRLIAYFVYQHFDTSVHQRPQGVSTYQCLLRLQTYFVPVGLSPELVTILIWPYFMGTSMCQFCYWHIYPWSKRRWCLHMFPLLVPMDSCVREFAYARLLLQLLAWSL